MDNSPALRQQGEPDTPGIGVAGTVMCPLFKAPCFKNGCEFWVELMYGQQKVGRCALAWQAILLTELRQSIDNLKNKLETMENNEHK